MAFFLPPDPKVVAALQPSGSSLHDVLTLKGFAHNKPFQGLWHSFYLPFPRLSLRSNLGLKLANAFGVYSISN